MIDVTTETLGQARVVVCAMIRNLEGLTREWKKEEEALVLPFSLKEIRG